MAKVIAVHIDQNGLYKFYLNAGYMLAYAKKFNFLWEMQIRLLFPLLKI
jgi:hypothetical protein